MKRKLKLITLSIAALTILIGCGGGSTASGLTGTTDEYGKFKYNDDDKVKFSLGKLILGESEPTTN
jgi:ABC-type glycerol-3-phosphate transport system substrate-binding protein